MRKRSIGLVFFLVFGALTVATGQNMPTYTPYPGFPLHAVERALFAYQTDFGVWPTDIGDLELYAEATGQPLDLDRFSVLTLEPKSHDTVLIIYADKDTDTEPNQYAVTRVTVSDDPTSVSPGKTAELEAMDTKTLVRRIQQGLTEKGYNPGPVDGIAGKRTHEAIRRFQADRRLTVDGEPTVSLLAILERSTVQAAPQRLTPADPLLVQKVQRELKRRGYDPGPQDGVVGQQTRQAIRQFLRDRQAAFRAAQAGTARAEEGFPTPAAVSLTWISVREQIRPKLWPNHIRRP
jgi:peptidoglycan hydrolase-like protein with peptidoglycan-binding domain